MNTIIDDSQIETMDQVRRFLAGSTAMRMASSSKAESYAWVRRSRVRFEYLILKRADRRMVGQYRETGKIQQ